MNLSGLSELLLAWAKSQGTALLGQDKPAPQGLQFQPGREYDARVLDNLPNGRHLVQLAGQKMDMPLPRNTQPGDAVRLTYLGGGARPTFLLNQTAQSQAPSAAQPVSLSSAAQQMSALSRLAGPAPAVNVGAARAGGQGTVPANPMASGPTAEGASPQGTAVAGRTVAISGAAAGLARSSTLTNAGPNAAAPPAGRLQAAVAPQVADAAAKPNPVPSPVPGLPASVSARPIATPEMLSAPAPGRPPATATAAAPAAAAPVPVNSPAAAVITSATRPIAANVVMLNTAVSAMPLAPGGAVSPNTALVGQPVEGPRAAVPSSTTLTPGVLAEMPGPSRTVLPARLFQTLSESGLFYESHLSRWAKGDLSFDTLLREPQARLGRELPLGAKVAELGGMPDEVARLAGRQLQLLDGAPLVWQGFAWPGQWMEWLVEERYAEGGEGGAQDEGRQWVTELHLHLPRMGSVHAHVGLRGDRLDLRLTAGDAAVREEMQAALPALVNGLEAAGLRAENLTVGLADET